MASQYGGFVMELVCALLWGCSLISLLRHLKSSKSLLPNLRIFKIHGILLVTYLVLSFITTTLDFIGNHLPEVQQEVVFGVTSIFYSFTCVASTLSFLLVLYVTLPIMSHQ